MEVIDFVLGVLSCTFCLSLLVAGIGVAILSLTALALLGIKAFQKLVE